MRALFWLVFAVSCTAPPISVGPAGDAGADARAIDAGPVCTEKPRFDGGVCDGVDEDSDCIPDSCDDCPNVPQEFSRVGESPSVAGSVCTHPDAKFAACTRRLLFEPFADVSAWTETLPRLPPEWALRANDGVALFGGRYARVAYAPSVTSAGCAVATAVFDVPEGGADTGIVLRFDPSTQTGYGCRLMGNSLSLTRVRVGMDGSPDEAPLVDDKGVTPELVFDLPLWSGRILLRGAVADDGSGVVLECQAFKAPNAKEVAGSLRSLESPMVRAKIASPIIPSGVVGIYATRQVMVESIDVLGAP